MDEATESHHPTTRFSLSAARTLFLNHKRYTLGTGDSDCSDLSALLYSRTVRNLRAAECFYVLVLWVLSDRSVGVGDDMQACLVSGWLKPAGKPAGQKNYNNCIF
ncbi:hypothetical protein HBH56_205590 [Parastagonospora nodorum]|nr:hypothetical protein HBH56_205590 [Parastagonospora nodorum]KAH3923797.1 hypothetical protein HBH54_204460 [Parastagonospora nodorum]KAH3967208.1 hypothetical protein HBH52_191970 [Parastagonospora nodorum]KAH4059834.1 hypothetical protein HBH49_024750 [Parastagonospora nodorum]KAH4115610.1 hypothetical protein HBH47_179570 [Parastagonospora nodorum]